MTTLMINLDDELNAALEALSADQGCDTSALLTEIIRRHVQNERLRHELSDPELLTQYSELEAGDRALAENGMVEHDQMLVEADCLQITLAK